MGKCNNTECSKEISPERKFCSRECSSKGQTRSSHRNKRNKNSNELEFEIVAYTLRRGKQGFVKGAALYEIPCEKCSTLTGLKSAGEINRQRRISGGVFCSSTCKRGIAISRVCESCGGPIIHSYHKNGKYSRFCSKICYSAWQMTPANKSSNNHNWKGGYEARNSNAEDYVIWRAGVYERDQYTCQECKTTGGKLNAHHLRAWSHYPSLRYEVDNGITLCHECHCWAHATNDPRYIVGLPPSYTNVRYLDAYEQLVHAYS